MGQSVSNVLTSSFGKKQIKLLISGLDASGKTTLLYKLKLGDETITTIPTIGFNVETVEYKNICFTMVDIGGGAKFKPWATRFHAQSSDGVIFIVDSTDRERIGEARDELHDVLTSEKLDDVVLLIFANKQDLPNPMTPSEIADELKLYELRNRRWIVLVGSATQMQGLPEALNWLYNTLTIS